MEVPFINLHTHTIKNEDNTLECFSCGIPLLDFKFTQHPFLQVGIHPWETSITEQHWTDFYSFSRLKNCMAIGEIGIDKIRGASLDKQIHLFERQLIWAKEHNKPVILHCVKAVDEIIVVLKKHQFKHPVIFHGFQGSMEQALQLTNNGYLLSFGANICNPKSKVIKALEAIPLTNIFLETDVSPYPITQIYEQVAKILNLKIHELKALIRDNFHRVFPDFKT